MNFVAGVDLASSLLHKLRREIRKNEVQQTDKQSDKQNPEVLIPHTHAQTNHRAPAVHRDNTTLPFDCTVYGTHVSQVSRLKTALLQEVNQSRVVAVASLASRLQYACIATSPISAEFLFLRVIIPGIREPYRLYVVSLRVKQPRREQTHQTRPVQKLQL
jgi:hypothetical protein